MCRTRAGKIQAIESNTDEVEQSYYPSQVSRVKSQDQPVAPTFHISTLKEDGTSWTAFFATSGTTVNFKLDTGAQVNILPRHEYRRLANKPALQPARIRLLAYGSNDPLPVDGQCVCKIEANDRQTKFLQFFIVPFAEEPLLGISACQDLGLIKRVDSTEVSALPVCDGNAEQLSGVVEDPLAREYLELFQGLGHIRDHPYSIRVHPYSIRVRDNVMPAAGCKDTYLLLVDYYSQFLEVMHLWDLRASRSSLVSKRCLPGMASQMSL